MRITIPLVMAMIATLLLSVELSHFTNADNLGVFSGLSWAFYLSIAILVSSVGWRLYTGKGSQSANLAMILLLQVFLLLVGFLVGGIGASSADSYGFIAYFEAILYAAQHGLGSVTTLSAEIGQWPAGTAFYSLLLTTTGLTNSNYAPQIVVVSRVLYGMFDTMLVFVTARTFYPTNEIAPTFVALLYAVGDFFVPAWFHDTSFAYTLFLLLVFFLVFFRERSGVPLMIILIPFVLSNLYASVIAIGPIVWYSIVTHEKKYLLIYSFIMGAWNVGYLFLYGSSVARYFLSNFFNFGLLAPRVSGSISQGSFSHHFIVLAQLGLAAFFGVGAITRLVSLKILGNSDDVRRLLRVFLYGLSAGFVGLIAAPGFGPNPIEGVERAYFFAFPFFIIMLGVCLGRRSIPIMIAFVVIAMPATMITTYGGVVPTYFTSSNQAGSEYLQTYWANNIAISLSFPASTPTGGGAFFFTNGSLILHYSTLYLNSSQILNLPPNTGPPMVGSLTQFLEVDSLIYTGSTSSYATFANSLQQKADIIYSNPDTQYYLI